MTIEEYLRKRIEDTEKNCREKHLDSYDNGYFDGYYDALDELLRKLPEMEYEVTLREVKEECDKHGGCSVCPMAIIVNNTPKYCFVGDSFIGDWDIAEIERRMKEARK